MNGVKQIILAVLVGLMATACRTTQTPDVTPSDVARIHIQKSSALVTWLDWEQRPEDLKDRDPFFAEAICDELVTRHEVDFLLASLNAATNDDAREWLVSDVLYSIDDHRVFEAFARRLGDKDDRESYYVALYLAEHGDTAALATLNRHYYHYAVASFEWASAVEAFGKFRYLPAATNLVDSLDAASLNVSAAACNSLHELYPNSPRHFYGPTEAKNYYSKRLSKASH
jgi:hypothetical protein